MPREGRRGCTERRKAQQVPGVPSGLGVPPLEGSRLPSAGASVSPGESAGIRPWPQPAQKSPRRGVSLPLCFHLAGGHWEAEWETYLCMITPSFLPVSLKLPFFWHCVVCFLLVKIQAVGSGWGPAVPNTRSLITAVIWGGCKKLFIWEARNKSFL